MATRKLRDFLSPRNVEATINIDGKFLTGPDGEMKPDYLWLTPHYVHNIKL